MKKRNDIAVLGVVYPKMRGFFDDYLKSLSRQTRKDFDLILVDAGFGSIQRDIAPYEIRVEQIPGAVPIPKNREIGMNYVRKCGYRYMVSTDTDDYYAPNRVEKSAELLRRHDIVINDMTTVNRNGRLRQRGYLSSRLKNLVRIDPNFLWDKNILGFSNTAVRVDRLKKKILLADELIAVDWYLYAGLMHEGCRAVFTDETFTYYRIYQGNTVGFSSKVDVERLLKSIEVKILHYENMEKKYSVYKDIGTRFKALRAKFTRDGDFRKRYIRMMRSQCPQKPFWWEEARLWEEGS